MAPRPDVRAPLVMERLVPPARTPELLAHAAQLAEVVRALPAPWQRLVDAQFTAVESHFIYQRFVGLTLRDVSVGLRKSKRVLPMDVLRTVVDHICEAFEMVVTVRGSPPPRAFFAFTDRSIGLSLDGRWHFAPGALNEWLYELMHSDDWDHARPPPDTIALLSPEALSGQPETPASAVTRSALLSWQLITGGHHPFRGRPRELAQSLTRFFRGDVLVPLTVHPGITEELAQLFTRGLAFRDGRFPDLDEFRRALGTAWPVPAANLERTRNVLASVAWPALERELHSLKREPLLPLQWEGVWTATQPPEAGITVLEDQLLEHLEPLELLPARGDYVPNEGPSPPPPLAPIRIIHTEPAEPPPPPSRIGLLRRLLNYLGRS